MALLWLSGPAGAEPVTVNLVTEPPGAAVKDQYGNILGRTGMPFPVDLESHGSTLEVTLILDGYEAKLERIKARELRAGGRFPRQGAIALRPLNVFVVVRTAVSRRPFLWISAGLLGLLGGAIFARRQRRLRRLVERGQVLERLKARAPEGEGALTMTVLSGYRLVEPLGRGGMATVYRGLPDQTLDEEAAVAIKVLNPEDTDTPEAAARFRREINLWKSLTHPNIVNLYDWGETEEGRTYLVMELIEGGTLRDHIRPGGVSVDRMLELIEPVFRAVSYANSRGVMHRDLKPENVMVAADGKVKVMDFGLARSGEGDKLTQTGTFVGTPAYMAPEQIQGAPPDPRSDQYALGTLVYELLCGNTPFGEQEQVMVIFQQVSSRPQPLGERIAGLPESLEKAVAQMLAKQPEQRFDDLDQALAALTATPPESPTLA